MDVKSKRTGIEGAEEDRTFRVEPQNAYRQLSLADGGPGGHLQRHGLARLPENEEEHFGRKLDAGTAPHKVLVFH